MPLLYLVDGSSQMYRAFHAPIRTNEGTLLRNAQGLATNAVYIFVTMLRKLLKEHAPGFIVASFDLPGPTFRDDLAADYKANRKPMPDELAAQIPLVHRACEALGVPIVTADRYEADDVIGTMARKGVAEGYDVVIVTGDKDFFQLVGPGIRVFNPRDEGTWYDEPGVKEKFGVAPGQVVDVLALMGDTIDNVKGVPGIGEKGARELISTHGSLDALLEHAGEVPQKKYREALLANAEAARSSRELVTIHTDVAVEFDLRTFQYRGPSREACYTLFSELGFRSLTTEFAPTADTTSTDYQVVTTTAELQALVEELRGVKRLSVAVVSEEREPRESDETAGSDGSGAMRADVVGLVVSAAAGTARYVPIASGAPGGLALLDDPLPPALPLREVLAALGTVLEDPGVEKSGHDLKFVSLTLAERGVRLEGLGLDTMLASYLLNATGGGHSLESAALEYLAYRALSEEDVRGRGAKAVRFSSAPVEKVRSYAGERADLAMQLEARLTPLLAADGLERVYSELEQPLIPVLVAMERAGVRVDTAALAAQSQHVERELSTRSTQIFALAGEPFNINSPKQLSEILFDKLQLPVSKRNVKTRTASTAVEVLEELALTHELPRLILEWRALQKLKGTYIDALPLLVHPRTGRVHTSFNQAVAATGRLSSSDPNLQNIPIRTPLGREIRRAFVAEPGPRAHFGRLLADRAARARAPVGRRDADPGVPRRPGHPRADRRACVRRSERARPARAAQQSQDDQLRAALREDGVHAVEGHRRHAAGCAGVHRRLLRRLPTHPRVHRSHAGGSTRVGCGQDALWTAPPDGGAEQPQSAGSPAGRARSGEHADSRHGGRHHEARDDRRPPRARRHAWRTHDSHGPRRAVVRSAGGGSRRGVRDWCSGSCRTRSRSACR